MSVIGNFDGGDIFSLSKGDLDGDGLPEVLAVARYSSGEDFTPIIFRGVGEVKQIYPASGEDNIVIGREVSLSPGQEGTLVCVKNPVIFHEFGPPDLLRMEYFRLTGERLERVKEGFSVGDHFNQLMNLAAIDFQKGFYLPALNAYEEILRKKGIEMPAEAKAEDLFFQAESRKFLKDITGAISLYTKIESEFPQYGKIDSVVRERDFLRDNLDASSSLTLFIDASNLVKAEKLIDGLRLLDSTPEGKGKGPLGDRLLFLRGEILMSMGRVSEAISAFRAITAEFPSSPLGNSVRMNLQELEGNPEIPEE